MNKNLKKILILCIYNITLSANVALCCETNLNLILNNSNKKPSLTTINEMFGYITHQNYNQPNNEFTQLEQINGNPISKKRKITDVTNLLNPDDSFFNKELDKIQKTNEYAKINFSLIDTDEKYANIYSKIPGGKQAPITIKCDECNFETNKPLGEARNDLLAHRLTRHIEQYYPSKQQNINKQKNTKQNKNTNYDTRKNPDFSSKPNRIEYPIANQQLNDKQINTRAGQQINFNISQPANNIKSTTSAFTIVNKRKIEPEQKIEIEDEYIELDFSEINTEENYNGIVRELLHGKQTFVTLKCDKCSFEISKFLQEARNDLLIHRLTHIEQDYPSKQKNKIKNREIENEEIEHTKLNFSSIDTQQKYDDTAKNLLQGKQTFAIINCPCCDKILKGRLCNARGGMKRHIKAKHPNLHLE